MRPSGDRNRVVLPVSTVVLFVGANVPSARAVGLNSHDLGPILQGTFDVKVLLVVDVLEGPTVSGVLNPPLRTQQDQYILQARRGEARPTF